MAAELSEALGRTIVFQDLPVEEYVKSLRDMGVPPYVVQHLGGAMVDYQNGHMSGADDNVEKLTGRRSMTVGEFARAHADVLNGRQPLARRLSGATGSQSKRSTDPATKRSNIMTTPTEVNPVIFIHGLWIHSAAWAPWIELFESRGYSASAPGWPGDGPTVAATRDNPDALNDMGIPQMVDHYAELIGTPEVKPVVVGHSFGGLIAQELLANGVVAAAVAIDPAAIKGVKALPFAQLKSAFPVLGNPANLHRTVSLTPKQFHYAFGNTLTEEESNALHDAWTIPAPAFRCSRTPRRTSSRTRRPRSTPTWPTAGRCC